MSSVTYDEEEDGYYWWDETGSNKFGPFPTYSDAALSQRHYALVELDGTRKDPEVGHLAWWIPRAALSSTHGYDRRPVSVLQGAPPESRYDWEILALGSTTRVDVYSFELTVMTEMDVIAVAAAYPDLEI